MGAVYFYHLTRQPLERTLPMLLDKALGAGWRVEVRCPNQNRAAWLDEKLWLSPEDGFLPHGMAGSEDDTLHPVLLTTDPAESVHCIMSVGGSDVSADEVREKERVCILFDGTDEMMLTVQCLHLRRILWCDATRWKQSLLSPPPSCRYRTNPPSKMLRWRRSRRPRPRPPRSRRPPSPREWPGPRRPRARIL